METADDDPVKDGGANQPPPLHDRDLWAEDGALRAALAGADAADRRRLQDLARALGTVEASRAARDANRCLPELEPYDRGGRRLDRVTYHPAYHDFLRFGLESGYAARPSEETPGGHRVHAAMVYLHSQVEPGSCCPMTMTYAAVAALGADEALGARWIPKLTARAHDRADVPLQAKRAATMGMAMTEVRGGSDLRHSATVARRNGDRWRLRGRKWFCSAPMSDGFLTLAQAPGGLSCFLVARWCQDGTRNPIQILRLKDKLGNRSNASAEIAFDGAHAHLLGAEGDGIRTILPMVHHTRLDTAMAPAGLMRAALVEAHRWCRHRSAFQRRLIDQPLMRAVLADLALDWEAALALGFRVARAFDDQGAQARAFARIAVALAKFLSNKRCPWVVGEAMEVLGGMGYVEDTPLPLLYREAPLNAIWEGAGNVICLDVLRTLARVPLAAEALDAELDGARGADRRYDAALEAHRARWPSPPGEDEARWFTERLAMLLSAAQLLRTAPAAVADGYIATRVDGARGTVAGAVSGLDSTAILARLDEVAGQETAASFP